MPGRTGARRCATQPINYRCTIFICVVYSWYLHPLCTVCTTIAPRVLHFSAVHSTPHLFFYPQKGESLQGQDSRRLFKRSKTRIKWVSQFVKLVVLPLYPPSPPPTRTWACNCFGGRMATHWPYTLSWCFWCHTYHLSPSFVWVKAEG